MHLLEFILFQEERLADPQWQARLHAPGLPGCYCIVGSNGPAVTLASNDQPFAVNSQQVAVLPPDKKRGFSFSPPEGGSGGNGTVGVLFFQPGANAGIQHVLDLLTKKTEAIPAASLMHFFENTYALYASGGVFSLQAAHHSVASFLYQLAEATTGTAGTTQENAYLERALELMEMHVGESLSLKELSAALRISEAHCIRLFNKKMHMSPMKYYMRLKVHNAASMIIQGMKIKDAAERTGFYNEAHLSKQFKQYMGVPPREYKSAALQNLKLEYSENKKSLSITSALLSDFIDAIPDLIFFKDVRHVYRLCNKAFCAYVGKSKQDIFGHTDFTLFPEDVAMAFRRRDEHIVATLHPHANKEWIVYPNGQKRLVEAFKAPYFGAQKELLGVIGICRDTGLQEPAE